MIAKIADLNSERCRGLIDFIPILLKIMIESDDLTLLVFGTFYLRTMATVGYQQIIAR